VTVRDLGRERGGIVTFTVDGRDAAALRTMLLAQGINVSVASQAYTPLDMAARRLPPLLRASVHYYNSEDEVARFCAALAALL
jgi:cysteine desulfurase/selenocysteine lyase